MDLFGICISEGYAAGNACMYQKPTSVGSGIFAGVQEELQRFDTAKAKLEITQDAIARKKAQRQMMENFMETLQSLPEQVEIFVEGAWYALCDYITVYSKDDVRVTFQNGNQGVKNIRD